MFIRALPHLVQQVGSITSLLQFRLRSKVWPADVPDLCVWHRSMGDLSQPFLCSPKDQCSVPPWRQRFSTTQRTPGQAGGTGSRGRSQWGPGRYEELGVGGNGADGEPRGGWKGRVPRVLTAADLGLLSSNPGVLGLEHRPTCREGAWSRRQHRLWEFSPGPGEVNPSFLAEVQPAALCVW